MFILQIGVPPSTGSPAPVAERPRRKTGGTTESTISRELEKYYEEFINHPGGLSVDRMIGGGGTSDQNIDLQRLGLEQNPNGDGSYVRPGFTGRFFRQLDGSLYYEGGKHEATGKVIPSGTFVNGEPVSGRNLPLLGTVEIAELNLTRNQDGSFSRPDVEGKFFLQRDGSIYFTGGRGEEGNKIAPQTYKSGKGWDTGRYNPLASTFAIAELNLIPNQDGFTFSKNNMPGKYIPQTNGSVFYEGGINEKIKMKYPSQTYEKGVWDDKKTEPQTVFKWMLDNKLTINKNGNFTEPGYTGEYILQRDGTLFYTGGNEISTGKHWSAQTLCIDPATGKYKWDKTRNTPI